MKCYIYFFTIDEVKEAIMELNSNSVGGLDGKTRVFFIKILKIL